MTRRLALAAVVLALSSGPAGAEGPNDPILMVGVGTLSCATWLNEPAQRLLSEQWILGFWTAMNAYSEPGGAVGQSTDQAGIVGEVRKDCQGQPSLKLMYATYKAYIRMQKAGT